MNTISRLFAGLLTQAKALVRPIASLWAPRSQAIYRCNIVDDFPDIIEPRTIYFAGQNNHLWAAAMRCPCGCGEVIQLNLLKQTRPCWSANRQSNGTINLVPSIWRQKGCRSHFIVRNSKIIWCKDDVDP